MRISIILSLLFSLISFNRLFAAEAPMSPPAEVDVVNPADGKDPTTDPGMIIIDDAGKADPIFSGTASVPESWKSKYVYMGATYWGVYGCQVLGSYYGFNRVSYYGPYYYPGYWYYGYWINRPWSLTYCYGVKK